MDLFTFIALIFTVLAIWLTYRYFTPKANLLKKQGITCIPIYVGAITLLRMIFRPLHELINENYKKYGKVYGQFLFNSYSLVIGDPDIIRQVLVKDFHNFVDRANFETYDPVVDNMITLVRGEKWKRIRTVVSPTFSTGKIKKMTSVILDCTETLRKNFDKVADECEPSDVKKLIGAFTMDTIASTAFSTKVDSHNDPNNPFVVAALEFSSNRMQWKSMLLVMFNRLLKFIPYKQKNVFPTRFFTQTAEKLIGERRKTNQARNDFLQLMINASEKSRMGITDPDEDDVKLELEEKHRFQESNSDDNATSKENEHKGLSEAEILSQCVVFFVAGFETVASTIAFALYELAVNEDCQENLIQEIDEVLGQNNNELGYENVQSMKYMDCVVSETMRKYPPGFLIQRVAVRDCKLSDANIQIPKDSQIAIPVYALHYDEEYFPEPQKFDPNRFSPEEKAARDPYVYLPFGAGPRNCIAMRFALFEMKLCLASLLRHFRFHRCSKTQVPFKFSGGGAQLIARNIFLTVERRTDATQ